ncbi:hypothetical protein [Flavobacterium saccharophilum]|uniref:Uncharacterized protein n=1 Tax=Flavobacterium saccharophilum TaxID=29534 RepID=A0A1M7JGE6_9FLAO|nr:hypothetical protein [Flavobacterium saccharophilum]SHM52026.1 hypothetical protein SAMN05444366_3344 [Flavobacterium saccharophilum]
MTQVEINDLAIEIYNEIPNGDIKKYIKECIDQGETTKDEVKACVLFKIAQNFRKNAGL